MDAFFLQGPDRRFDEAPAAPASLEGVAEIGKSALARCSRSDSTRDRCNFATESAAIPDAPERTVLVAQAGGRRCLPVSREIPPSPGPGPPEVRVISIDLPGRLDPPGVGWPVVGHPPAADPVAFQQQAIATR